MPDRLGSSVVVISSERAHLRHRSTATWTTGIVVERSESEEEYVEDDEDEAEEARYCGLGREAMVK